MPDTTYNAKTYDKQGGSERVFASGATLTLESGATTTDASTATHTGTHTFSGTVNFTGAIQTGGVASDRQVKTAKVALAALDTAGGVLAWANPEGATIIIQRIFYNVTTKSTGACTVDTGVAANGTTSNDTLMDGLDVGAAAGLFDNIENHGTNGKARQLVTSTQFVTGSMASGAAAGLVGFAYIQYIVI